MAQLHLPANLRHILLRLLPSPEIMLAAQQLRVSNNLGIIRDSLWAINALIFDANLWAAATTEADLKKWLRDVSTVIVDIENILEVIQENYQQPKELEQQQIKVPSPKFVLCSRRRSILVELKQIAQSLNCLLSRTVAFGLRIDMIDSMDPNQVDYYPILQQEVVGRDKDISNILQIMFQLQNGQLPLDVNDDMPFFIAITGEKGIGKSTLARVVYHHPLVCEFFKHRIWVNVFHSTFFSFEHKQIARECVRHLTGRISSDIDIWNLLRRSIPQTRSLLVLDEFNIDTKEEKDKLEQLMKNLLSLCAPGSRVIITNHTFPGTKQIIYFDKEYELHTLSQDALTKLFLRSAIPKPQFDQAKEISSLSRMIDFLNIANEQYDKIKYYSPIEAKICGSRWRHTTLGYYDFEKLNEHDYVLAQHSIDEIDITKLILYAILFEPLPLAFTNAAFDMLITDSIFHYSTHSQQLFQQFVPHTMDNFLLFKQIYGTLLFGIKRSIYHFNKRKGQEFKIPQQCRYLCVLVDSNTSTCLTKLEPRIANNLRMLMLYKVKEEMDLLGKKNQKASSIEIPKSLVKNLIILSIIDTGIKKLPNTITMLHRLRYLNISEKEMEELPKYICGLHNLRVLSLSHCKKLLKLPEKIHKLTKLQILRLAYCTRLQKLPKSITRLVNLQVLDIEACYWLTELPEELRHLERLMNLHMIGCASLTQIPIGISKLANLEALSGYIVDENDHGSLAILELQSLTSIEQLQICHLECVLNLNAITSVNLKEKHNLEKLVLHWEWWNMKVRENNQLESIKVLDGLQSHAPRLKRLEIISYLGMQFPNWIMMDRQVLLYKSLAEIRLVNLKRCKNLPLLCRLYSLALLEMSGMDSLTCVGSSTISNEDDTFPNLEKLILSEMLTLEQWNIRCPRLQQLTLIHCPKLISLYGLEPKNKLTIWLQSELLGEYSSSFQSDFRNIDELEVVGCHEMRKLPEDIVHCKYLETLSVIRCNKLLSVPNWLQKLPRLRRIFLVGCTTISCIPKELKQQLKAGIIIQGCSKLQARIRREKHVK